jgi:hypothetical protein
MLTEKAEQCLAGSPRPQALQISGDGAPLSRFDPVLEHPWASVGGISLAMFSDPAASASGTSFSSINLTVSLEGSFDNISLLGCLTTGSGCGVGNQLSPRRITVKDEPSKGLNTGSIPVSATNCS